MLKSVKPDDQQKHKHLTINTFTYNKIVLNFVIHHCRIACYRP